MKTPEEHADAIACQASLRKRIAAEVTCQKGLRKKIAAAIREAVTDAVASAVYDEAELIVRGNGDEYHASAGFDLAKEKILASVALAE